MGKKEVGEKRKRAPAIYFEMTAREKLLIQTNANIYCNGNISAWLKWAGVDFAPKITNKAWGAK